MNIDIKVRHRIAYDADELLIANNTDYTITFDFDDEWAAHTSRVARFIINGSYTDVIFTGNTVTVPRITNNNTAYLFVGVYSGDLYTTTPAMIKVRKSIIDSSPVQPTPTPEVYTQILALLNGFSITASKTGKITTITIVSPNGTQTTTLEDGEDGEDGAQGPQGPQGNPGQNGTNGVSVTGCTINAQGHLIVTLSSGQTIDAGVAKGADGSQVSVSPTGESTSEVSYITINGNEYKIAGSGQGGEPAAYIKSASVSQDGNTLTLVKKDDTTVVFAPQGGGGSGGTDYVHNIIAEYVDGDMHHTFAHFKIVNNAAAAYTTYAQVVAALASKRINTEAGSYYDEDEGANYGVQRVYASGNIIGLELTDTSTIPSGTIPLSATITDYVYSFNAAGGGSTPKVGTINISASWQGSTSPYSQTIVVSGATITANSKVDIQADNDLISQMIADNCNALYITNNNGTLTLYAIGAALSAAVSGVQVTVTEVSE